MSEAQPESDRPFDQLPSARLKELLTVAEPLVLADAERAAVLLREAQDLARQTGDARSEALALLFLGASLYFRSQYQAALAVLDEAQSAADLVGDDRLTARIENSRGNCAVALGEYGQGMEHYQKSLNLAQSLGDIEGRARALSNVGLIHIELGDYPLALEVFQEVLMLARQSDLPLARSSATINTVLSLYHVGRLEDALAVAEEFLPALQNQGLRQNEVVLRTWMLPCLTDLGRAAETVRQAQDLLPLAEDVNDRQYVVYVLLFLGQALMELGQVDAAHDPLQRALDDARQHGMRPQQRLVLLQLGRLHAARGAWQQAYELSQAYQELDRVLQSEAVERKAKVLGAQMQVEILRREAEVERRRTLELTQANTALQAAQETLAYRATHDGLTGLANRGHFQAELERALETAGETPFGVLFLDLDRFKQVNDTLGHDVGDELLKEVARRLKRVVRAGDLVARMGGDEFTVILHGLRGPADAEVVAGKILHHLAQPMEVNGHVLHVTASIGVALAPQDGTDVTTLQKHADIAMYRAKHEGKNGVRTFQPVMGSETAEQMTLEQDLREALNGQELTLHYQGQFDAHTQALLGFEALVRWAHPTQGLLPPLKFIPVAESSGLIVPLGAWVLQEACRQAAVWNAQGQNLTISVNVSALQFEDPAFLPAVEAALRTSGLDSHQLILELTESAVLKDPEAAAQQFMRLKALGVRIALDDFGLGQSNLSLLRRLPVDILKIDRSFVQDHREAPEDAGEVYIGVMINLAHGLKLRVTAEGVESSEQLSLLEELGCDSIQGFLLARPLPPDEAAASFGVRGTPRRPGPSDSQL